MKTGYQLRGVALKCYDFRSCSTPVGAPKPKYLASKRRRVSIQKCNRRAKGQGAIAAAVHDLFSATSSERKRVCLLVQQRSRAAVSKKVGCHPVKLHAVMKLLRATKQRQCLTAGTTAAAASRCGMGIWKLSEKLQLSRTTYASINQFTRLFVATITSKSEAELRELDARLKTTAADVVLAVTRPHGIPQTVYGEFAGVQCRAMSKMWREIKRRCMEQTTNTTSLCK